MRTSPRPATHFLCRAPLPAAALAAMWLKVLGLLVVVGVGEFGKVVRVPFKTCYVDHDNPESIYNFTMTDLWGQRNISLSDYKGKVVLITNVATY